MSRRKPPSHRWHVGERCQVSVVYFIDGREMGRWDNAEVVAVRGDRVVVRRYRWETPSTPAGSYACRRRTGATPWCAF